MKLTAIAFALLSAACVLDPDLELEGSAQTVLTDNRLSFNRLSFNRLSFNRLSFNRLSFNRLSFNRLSFNSLAFDGMEETEGGREALAYLAKCALAGGDILVVETADGSVYEMPGLFGLAPSWEVGPPPATELRWVSGCLLAHVNAFGVQVPISVRAPGVIEADKNEQRDYRLWEAGYFGDVFSGSIRAFACAGEAVGLENYELFDRALRVCSDPDSPCEIEPVGQCLRVCNTNVPNAGSRDCLGADGQRMTEVVSVFLATEPAYRDVIDEPTTTIKTTTDLSLRVR